MTTVDRFRIALVVTLALLPVSVSGCSAAEDDPVRIYVDEAIEAVGEGYYAEGSTWDDAVDEALPQLYAAQSVSHTYVRLGRLTKVAGGEHSRFSTPADVAALEAQASSGAFDVPTVSYGGGVATVTIPAFGSDHEEAINDYLAASAGIFGSADADTACGWVVDLSANSGGNIWTMLVASSPLLDDGVVETFRNRDGSVTEVTVDGNTVTWDGTEWGSFPGETTKLVDRRVAIVQSSVTASAAESLVLAFTGQDGVATFGA